MARIGQLCPKRGSHRPLVGWSEPLSPEASWSRRAERWLEGLAHPPVFDRGVKEDWTFGDVTERFVEPEHLDLRRELRLRTAEEEIRVWHDEKNLKRREKCFEIAKSRNVQPIQVALAYVIQKSPLIFPLIGPRTVMETDSSITAVQLNLSKEEMNELFIN